MSTLLILGMGLALAGASPWPVVDGDKPPPGLFEKTGVLFLGDKPFSGEIVHHHVNGQLSKRSGYSEGQKDGLELSWFENGDLAEIRDYTHGNKSWVHWSWYPNGQRSFSAEFKDGVYHGKVQSWYPSGQIASDQQFRNGYENGLQRAWRDNGDLYANYEFREGRRFGLYNPGLCFKLNKNGKTN